MPGIFLYAFCIGFVLQMPIGPTAFLCFRRFAVGGVLLAAATGFGTAFGDTAYAAVAAAGLHGWGAAIQRYDGVLRFAGGAILILAGAVLSWKPFTYEATEKTAASRDDLYGAFASMFFMTLLNPATAVLVAGVLGSLGLRALLAGSVGGVAVFTIGFLAGSCCWWALFAEILRICSKRLGPGFFAIGSRASGLALTLVGVVVLLTNRFGGFR